jgi:hypothetical protein
MPDFQPMQPANGGTGQPELRLILMLPLPLSGRILRSCRMIGHPEAAVETEEDKTG